MTKIKIEIISNHNCSGNQERIPEIVNDFRNESGAEMDFIVYCAWDISDQNHIPKHIRVKVDEIKMGKISNSGLFINESWYPLSPHSAHDSVAVRNALFKAYQHTGMELKPKIHGNKFDNQELKSCLINKLSLNDCNIQNLQTFCSIIDKISFFADRIGTLEVQSHVESFHFGGYDIHKLIKAANEHPDIFAHARSNPEQGKSVKVDILQISFVALNKNDLQEGKHPCIITGGCLNPESKPFILSAEIFGAWGYVAKHADKTCGFLGIMPKSIAQKDANFFIPPSSADPEKTLLLNCFAGGVVFGEKYSGIGIAKGLVKTALKDAKLKEYDCVEANPHDPGISHVLEKCGFHRINWTGGGSNSLRDQSFYRIALK